MVRTKIICTMGPSVNTLDMVMRLIESGMNVARLNFSHGTHEEHAKTIAILKEARKKSNVPLAIMLDTKGPEIRLGMIKNNEISLKLGHQWLLVRESLVGDSEKVTVNPPYALDTVKQGDTVLFDDGYISSKVIKNNDEGVLVEILNPGNIKSGKKINIPNVNVNLPAVTKEDIADIRFGCQQDIDLIAASFVRSAEHVLEIKRLLTIEKKPDILVVAKIENSEGVQNFDSIVEVADGIMIARGDLGVEVPLSQVPRLQKMMIRKSYLAGKPTVTATQMLESMIHNPRPTRAEASDVANAIYDGTSSVMLSGETAVGKYPIETVNVMRSIIREAEGDFDYKAFFEQHAALLSHDVPSAVTLATVQTAYSTKASAIFAFTSGGSTARLISRLKPAIPIIALTHNEKCYHQMSFAWGTIPVLSSPTTSTREAFNRLSLYAMEHQIVGNGDLVVVTAGSPFGISGTTNMMMVESIGDVLVRGSQGYGPRVHGNVVILVSAEAKKPYSVSGQIIVLASCDESYLSHIKEAAGIILQNHVNDLESEQYLLQIAKTLQKPVLVEAESATRILKEGQLITLDPEKAIVCKGVVF